MDKKRKSYILSCEISSIEHVQLGGYQQTIAIEGREKKLPVVICLHGGPGLPIPFSVGCRGLFPEITDRFIMVYWDQLGCGINNCKIDNSFTIGHFVKMTVDLIKEIRVRFPENKLFLFGMSWGSILALHAAVLIPDLIDGAVTYGQIVTAPLLSDSAFDAIKRSSAPFRQKNFAENLRRKRPEISLKELMMLSKLIRKYTDGYTNRASKTISIGSLIRGLLTSPDYRCKDFIAIFKNGYMQNGSIQSNNLMWEMAAADYSSIFSRIAIPYHIFQGETDIVTATNDLVHLLDGLNNKNVTYAILPGLGHFPSETALQEILKKINQPGLLY